MICFNGEVWWWCYSIGSKESDIMMVKTHVMWLQMAMVGQ